MEVLDKNALKVYLADPEVRRMLNEIIRDEIISKLGYYHGYEHTLVYRDVDPKTRGPRSIEFNSYDNTPQELEDIVNEKFERCKRNAHEASNLKQEAMAAIEMCQQGIEMPHPIEYYEKWRDKFIARHTYWLRLSRKYNRNFC